VSARLDGEPLGVPSAVLEEHLATCPACAQWTARATDLSRQFRLGAADVPDLTAVVATDVLEPARRVARRRTVLRVVLLVIGLVQVGLAVPALGGDSIGMHMSEHGSHETAAWNLAIGAAFLATVLAPRRAAGLIALLSAFILVLSVLTIHDLAAGMVSIGRVATHLTTVFGLVLLVLLDRGERALPPGRFHAASTPKDEPGSTTLRGVA